MSFDDSQPLAGIANRLSSGVEPILQTSPLYTVNAMLALRKWNYLRRLQWPIKGSFKLYCFAIVDYNRQCHCNVNLDNMPLVGHAYQRTSE